LDKRNIVEEGLNAVADIARFAVTPPKNPALLKDWECEGFHCQVIQGPFSINGYVAVPKSHPDYEKDYFDIDVDVHGGLTFGEKGEKDSELYPDENLYWLGFDTAHGYSGNWTLEMVVEETERLAKQLAERR